MHLMPKCILATQRVHFPKENVQLCKNAFDAYILFCKNAFLHQQNVTNAFDAKMHFCNATHHIFLCKMFSITFSFVKCSASHFPKENVQHQQNVMLCFVLQKYIFTSNTFLHQIYFCIKSIFASNLFLH